MGLRKDTEMVRCTLAKAFARVLVPADNGPEGSYRKVLVTLRQGIAVFRVLEDGYDANTEIAAGRTFEWNEIEGPLSQGLSIKLRPNQVLWGMVAATNPATMGLVHCGAVIEYHDGGA